MRKLRPTPCRHGVARSLAEILSMMCDANHARTLKAWSILVPNGLHFVKIAAPGGPSTKNDRLPGSTMVSHLASMSLLDKSRALRGVPSMAVDYLSATTWTGQGFGSGRVDLMLRCLTCSGHGCLKEAHLTTLWRHVRCEHRSLLQQRSIASASALRGSCLQPRLSCKWRFLKID